MNSIRNDVKKGSGDVMLKQGIKRVLLWQCIVSLLLLLGILVFYGVFDDRFLDASGAQDFSVLIAKLKASVYGAILAIAGTILSARSMRTKNGGSASELGTSALVPIYSGLLNKLVIVGGGIGFGLIALDLEPIFVVSSYFIVQVAVAVPFGLADTETDKGAGVE